jgi:hypothetical protein
LYIDIHFNRLGKTRGILWGKWPTTHLSYSQLFNNFNNQQKLQNFQNFLGGVSHLLSPPCSRYAANYGKATAPARQSKAHTRSNAACEE